MKLYTKQMFLIAAEKCEVSMIDAEHIMRYIDEFVTPIQLPSDEEIKREIFFEEFDPYDVAFLGGATWMRNKIQGGNK